jgi:CRISPR-associated endonuclease/helicase Cas3
MSYEQLWAKSEPYHPLWCHLLDVSAVCAALLPRFGGIEELPKEWLVYLVGLHDVGKADARFQGKAPELAVGLVVDTPGNCVGFRHEARSAEWIMAHLSATWGVSTTRVIMQAIRGHHGDFQAGSQSGADYREQNDYPQFFRYYSPLREQFAQLLADAVQLPPQMPLQFSDASAAGMKLSGLIVLSDWIASNAETFRYPGLQTDTGPDAYYAAACAEAQIAVKRLELDGGDAEAVSEPVIRAFSSLWPECRVLRPTQKALEEAVFARVPAGLAVIEAPMGEGKTEAALYLAACWNRRGAYIALPTQATSNQMHGRYQAFLARTDPRRAPRLVHGMAWLLDEVTPEEGARTEGIDNEERLLSREWFANAKRALLASDGVGTVDQVLMAALNVKHGFLRFLGLTTKTLIIDEVHAYDVYMTTLMKTLLQWCRALDIPVILLSATLSRRQKQELAEAYGGPGALPKLSTDASQEPYPLLTFVPREGNSFVKEAASEESRRRTVLLQRHPGVLHEAAETARLAQEAVAGGGCACVLANTVKAAQAIFQELVALRRTGQLPRTKLYLFHARYRAEKRQERENTIVARFGKKAGKSRPRRAIVVGTQVLEQSLDIDFDVMLSQIAPIDLLLQRCGRLHRHAPVTRPANQPAVLHLLLPLDNGEPPDFKGMGVKRVETKKGVEWRGVYDQATLLRTLALLESLAAFHLPADFRPLIESCYGDVSLPVSSIAVEWIESAENLRKERQEGSKEKAKRHLIAEPNPRVFKYAQPTGLTVVEGEEGESASFFRAQTREGSDTRNVLVLHDLALFAEVCRGSRLEKETDQEWRPSRKTLKRLFLQKASLPVYWLAGVEPAEGYEWIAAADAAKRLRHHAIFFMQNGTWKGIQTNKAKQADKQATSRITITDDDTLGLIWTSEKE